MTDREITYTVRASLINSGPDRFITHVGGPWGLAAEEDAIRDIRYGFHQYFVCQGRDRIEVRIAKGVIRNYLMTLDESRPELLLSLPQPFSGTKVAAADESGDSAISLRWVWDNRPAA